MKEKQTSNIQERQCIKIGILIIKWITYKTMTVTLSLLPPARKLGVVWPPETQSESSIYLRILQVGTVTIFQGITHIRLVATNTSPNQEVGLKKRSNNYPASKLSQMKRYNQNKTKALVIQNSSHIQVSENSHLGHNNLKV